MSYELNPCPLCGSTNITCFAEYDGDSYDNEPIYRAVVACLGCHEEGCDPSYDDEPCFGIEAYFPDSHPLLKGVDDPSDCERVLERYMAERWNRRAESTCRLVLMDDEAVIAERAKSPGAFFPQDIPTARFCSACGAKYPAWAELPENLKYCNMCGAKVVGDD